MKRMICILLTVLFLLCGCTGQAAPDKKQETQKIPALPSLQGYDLYAGFARADITPEAPVPLAGYGNTEKRISRNVLDPLYVDALALTDAQGNTVLLMNWDGTRSYTQVQELVRAIPRDAAPEPVILPSPTLVIIHRSGETCRTASTTGAKKAA